MKAVNNNQGVALILAILLMSLMFFMSSYFLDYTLTEKRISKSQTRGARTYYLAEAGIADMIWKLKNNATYKNNFESDPSWTTSFTRVEPFGSGNGSYTVTITNSSLAHGEIISTGEIEIEAGKITKRVIRTQVYRALGQSIIEDSAVFADKDIDIKNSLVNFYNGSAHANDDFKLKGASELFIEIDLEAVNNYEEDVNSTSVVNGTTYAKNYPPAAVEIAMLAIDFSSNDPNSYKNQADVVYSENEFKDLLENDLNLVLNNNITYVNGNVELPGGSTLTVNGLLVVKKDFKMCGGDVGGDDYETQCTTDHIHHFFDWGMIDAEYLDIIWHGSGGDVTTRIDVQAKIDGDRFDTKTINETVDGEEQEINKIHTHDLSVDHTVLCVHLKEADVSKIFDIEIDGTPITFYDANPYSNTYPGVTCQDQGKRGQTGDNCSLIINHASGTPSGLLSAKNIKMERNVETVNIQGLVYASNKVEIKKVTSDTASIDILGGVVSREFKVNSSWQPINITFDNDIVIDVFEATSFSPVIVVEHWEEEY